MRHTSTMWLGGTALLCLLTISSNVAFTFDSLAAFSLRLFKEMNDSASLVLFVLMR